MHQKVRPLSLPSSYQRLWKMITQQWSGARPHLMLFIRWFWKDFSVFYWSDDSTQRKGRWILIAYAHSCFARNKTQCADSNDARPKNLAEHANSLALNSNRRIEEGSIAPWWLFVNFPCVRRQKLSMVCRRSSLLVYLRLDAPRPPSTWSSLGEKREDWEEECTFEGTM